MTTQNLKRKKNNNLKNQKRIRPSKISPMTNRLSAKHEGKPVIEDDIKALKQQMEFILGVTKTGLDIIDSEFNVRYIDPEWAKVYGDPTGKKCYQYFMDRSEVCPDCGIPIALKTKTIAVTKEILVKEGNRSIQVTNIPFQNNHGEWLVAEVNVDISERNRTEEALRKANDEMEMRVQERTAELVRANEALKTEVAERKRVERELRESETKYRELTDSLPEAVYETDENGKILFANRCAFEIFGYTQEDFDQGLSLFEMLIPEEQEKVRQNLLKLFQGEKIVNKEYTALRKDGSTFPILASVNPIVRNNKFMGIRGVVVDITERKKAEDSLSRESSFRNAIIEHATEGLCVCHEIAEFPHITFTVWNNRMTEITGYTMNEINRLGWYQTMYTDPEVQVRAIERMARLRQGDNIVNEEWEITRADGEKRVLSISTSVLQTGHGVAHVLALMHDITEHKHADKMVRQSEEKYRTILQNITDGYYEVDLSGHLTFFNDSVTELLGYPKEELLGKDNREYVDQENAKKLYETFNRVYRTGVSSNGFDWEIIRKDGTKRYIEASVSLVKTPLDQPIGFRGIVRDVTDRKRIEGALRSSEKKYRELYQNLRDGSAVVNMEGKIIEFNEAFQKMLGYEKEEIYKLTYEDITPKKWHSFETQILKEQVLTRGYSDIYEKEYRKKDGTIFPVNLRTYLIRNECHSPIGMWAVIRDITEQKRSEENLRESEEKYRLLVEKSLQGIVIAQGVPPRLVFANPAMTTILGFTSEDLSSFSIKETEGMIHPENRAAFFKNYKAILEGEAILARNEVRAIRKDGRGVWLELSSARITYKGQPAVQATFIDITEHKQAEEALRESEERYRTILENIEDGYYEVDLKGNFTFFNDSLSQMLGYSKDEMLGMGNQQYTDEENRKKLFQAFNEVYRTGKSKKGFGWEVFRKDRTKLFGEVSVSIIKDSTGQPIGFRGIARDITERKRAEEEIRQTLSLLNATLESTADGFLVVNREGKIESFNQRFVQMWRIPEPVIASKDDDQALAFVLDQLKEPEGFLGKVKKLYSQPTAESFDLLEFKDGRFFERYSLPQRIGDQCVGRVWSFRDVTEHKKAEEALRNEKQRFQSLSENAPFGMVMIDKDGSFRYINPKFRELFGYELAEIPDGRTWFRKAYPDPTYRHQVIEAWINDLKSTKPGEKRSQVYKARCKDGTEKIINFIPVQLETGENLMACEDITQQKQAEQEMKFLEEQFRQSQKMEAVGRLAGGIAHDFNNLLTVIKGYSQLSLLDLTEKEPLWGNIQEIQKATQLAADLTRQLLAFSRRQILDLKVLDLNTLLRDLTKMLRRIISEDIELVILLTEDLGRVRIDPGQFEQMILNLAVNARDAMLSGGKLTIETANATLDEEYAHTHISVKPGPYVQLSISDTGVGMPFDIKEKVFEPFFTTKEKGKGTGLGLSTVYGIVKQSEGNIWVYSEPGHGTTFKIYLPRVEEELDSALKREETDFLPRGNETVLLVEDDPLVRDLAHRLLSQQGYTVLEANNGEEALRVVLEHAGEKIHLLLTDVVMPQMGGKELSEKLKRLRPNIGVLYTSGYTDNAIVHHGKLELGTYFLQKPFSPKTLSHKVREVLDR